MNEAALDHLGQLLATEADTFGPEDGTPLLSSWCLVASWVDAETGEQDLSVIAMPNTTWPTIVGLLEIARQNALIMPTADG